MAIKPILFNTEMVRAILDGRKSCTRRIVKPQQFIGMLPDKCKNGAPEEFLKEKKLMFKPYCDMTDIELINTAYKASYQPGDILYVRETWSEGYEEGTYIYRASDKLADLPTFKESSKLIYHPSIHMPKEATRIWLRVTDVRVERLQEITKDGAKAEGAIDNRGFIHSPENEYDCIHTAQEHFIKIWNSTIKKSDLDSYGWSANPWVWVIEFERCEKPEGV
jgi:hypothetical protein|nr:MAG TPA: ASCH domain protein [Caudoviricetes sp.]